MSQKISLLFAVVLASGGAHAGTLDRPAAIAPGSAADFSFSTPGCPTFHWGGVEGARRMELVVYRLEGGEPSEVETSVAGADLRAVLPGTARGWTPSLSACLAPGLRYAWAVRALGAGEASPWSQPLLFRVPSEPSPQELAAAIDQVRRHLGAGGAVASEPTPRGRPDPRSSSPRAEPVTEAGGAPRTPSIPGTAALRAESAATSGQNHGLIGVTQSADGFALAGENTGGGPDLLLRGETGQADAELAEGFLDRPSEGDQGFDFRNSLAGAMTVSVEGVEVVTTATDQDTLAALGCAPTQVPQWNGSQWSCAATGTDTLASLGCSADEIARFGGTVWGCSADRDTLGLLACGPGEVARWNGAVWACAAPTDTLASLSCAAEQVVHWDGAAWACGQPGLSHQTCTDSGFPGDCTANCPAGSSVWVGGCTSGPNDYLKINRPTGGAAGPSGWRCQSGDLLGSSSSVTVELYCIAD